MSPAPSTRHQFVVLNLATSLRIYLVKNPLGEVTVSA
jgi:hypothetical protein